MGLLLCSSFATLLALGIPVGEPDPAEGGQLAGTPPNILVILGDDLGVDRIGVYAEHPSPGNTPNLDALAANGILFRNTWAYDVCSSTRASILTGKHGRRTGLGTFILTSIASYDLPVTEVSLADILAAQGYRTAAVGKWHLSAQLSATDWLTHPLQLGFEHHWGPITNLLEHDGDTYYDFPKNIDGTLVQQQAKYATTDQVDDALTMMETFGSQPWFIWLAFNAPHKPYHAPPTSLHSFNLGSGEPPPEPSRRQSQPAGTAVGGPGTALPPGGVAAPPIVGPPLPGGTYVPPDPNADPVLFMKAATQAMDTEIGRLLASMDPVVFANTVIIFIGDNGTNGPSISPPWDPAKGKSTMYEGGINVPMIIRGRGVASGQESPALLHVADLFATIAEIAGADGSTGLDSTSFATHIAMPSFPTPNLIYGERFRPNGFGPFVTRNQVARNTQYKYWRNYINGNLVSENLYDLLSDPMETNDLSGTLGSDPAAQAAWDQLSAHVDAQL